MDDNAPGRAARQRRQPDRAERIRLADLARAYYLEGASKVEIAQRFALSRFQVAKMLDDALEHGVVTIEIHDPRSRVSDLDERLAEALGISRAHVVGSDPDDSRATAERVGVAVMQMLQELVRPGMTVGISWSRALDLAARFLPDLPPCELVQLAGVLTVSGAGSLPRVIAQLGGNPSIRTFPISAPLVVDERSTALDLMRQPEIAEALERADHLDLAVVAIGAWRPTESTVWEKVGQADRDAGTAAGAVAEISGRLLTASGEAVRTPLDERTISVRIDQLAKAPQVIAVARGAGRVDAVLAAVRAQVVSCLVVDAELADALLASFAAGTDAASPTPEPSPTAPFTAEP